MQPQHEPQRLRVICVDQPGTWFAQPLRILDIDAETGTAYLFGMHRPWVAPRPFPWGELRDIAKRGELQLSDFQLPPRFLLPDEQLTDSERGVRDCWWRRLKGALDGPVRFLLYEDRGSIVADLARSIGVSKVTIYQKIYRFYYYGLVSNAFLPRYDERGGPGKTRASRVGVAKRGRPKLVVTLGHDESDIGVNITPSDIANIRWAMKHYEKGEHVTFSKAHEKMCEHKYVDVSDKGLTPLKNRPSLRQFIYHARRLPDFDAIVKRRVGNVKWNKQYRAITGKSSAEVLGPTDRYEIDATIADVYLVSSCDRTMIIGRPVLYLVVDKFSTYYVGLYIGLEGPSWEGARLALLNAFCDKEEFLERYDIHPDVPWGAHHICGEVMADRAELLGINASGLRTGLGISVGIAPPFRPDLKGLVEHGFQFLNGVVIHFTPGAVLRRNRERHERNWALDGTLTLYEFYQIVIRWILHRNEHCFMEERLTRGMRQASVAPTPGGLFRFGLEYLTGGTPFRTREEIYAHLLPSANAKVQEDGIHFGGARYTSAYAQEHQWFERARQNRFHIPIRYHNETPERIWIISSPESGVRQGIHEARMLDPFGRFGGARFEEIQDLTMFDRLKKNCEYKEDNFASVVNTRAQNEATIAAAKAEKNALPDDKSSRSIVKGIRENREAERALERKSQADLERATFGSSAATTPDTSLKAEQTPRIATPLELKIWNQLNANHDN